VEARPIGAFGNLGRGVIPVESFQDYLHPEHMENEKFHPNFNVKPEYVYKVVYFGFPEDYVVDSLANNACNHATTTYYLLSKNQNIVL
jgi:hypothetical protein